ncbi:hypothetical protein H4219_001718 [Mycoemilia scoparia]|uniref:ATP synthase subunit K, mitochondrial n=1 Tax=Mycoemilia scoparia TaxID=417184 RepID=A0A9W8A7F2_9FUNG|nr:hypothetical protein H4219_001718 [Mycoemilia scoparia]
MAGNFYMIAGRKVPAHYLVIGLLGTYGGLISAFIPKTDKTAPPPIKASSDDELKFVQDFLKAAEAEDKKSH